MWTGRRRRRRGAGATAGRALKIRLAADEEAPRQARSFVARLLAEHALPAGVAGDDVILVTSELVTNAVQAGATGIELDVLLSASRLDLVVLDDGGGWPARAEADPLATSGRGLGIVDQLSDRWNVSRIDSRNKRVTASWLLNRPR